MVFHNNQQVIAIISVLSYFIFVSLGALKSNILYNLKLYKWQSITIKNKLLIVFQKGVLINLSLKFININLAYLLLIY